MVATFRSPKRRHDVPYQRDFLAGERRLTLRGVRLEPVTGTGRHVRRRPRRTGHRLLEDVVGILDRYVAWPSHQTRQLSFMPVQKRHRRTDHMTAIETAVRVQIGGLGVDPRLESAGGGGGGSGWPVGRRAGAVCTSA
jgi:hypothetical protein